MKIYNDNFEFIFENLNFNIIKFKNNSIAIYIDCFFIQFFDNFENLKIENYITLDNLLYSIVIYNVIKDENLELINNSYQIYFENELKNKFEIEKNLIFKNLN
jgi:hypothetical protein